MNNPEAGLNKNMELITVFKLEERDGDRDNGIELNCKDYYKITLLRNCGSTYHGGKISKISGTVLMFLNPHVSYLPGNFGRNQSGFLCLFSKSFFTEALTAKLKSLPMYAEDGISYKINEGEDLQVSAIFTRMLNEQDSQYAFKYDLLRNYVAEILHFALKSLSHK